MLKHAWRPGRDDPDDPYGLENIPACAARFDELGIDYQPWSNDGALMKQTKVPRDIREPIAEQSVRECVQRQYQWFTDNRRGGFNLEERLRAAFCRQLEEGGHAKCKHESVTVIAEWLWDLIAAPPYVEFMLEVASTARMVVGRRTEVRLFCHMHEPTGWRNRGTMDVDKLVATDPFGAVECAHFYRGPKPGRRNADNPDRWLADVAFMCKSIPEALRGKRWGVHLYLVDLEGEDGLLPLEMLTAGCRQFNEAGADVVWFQHDNAPTPFDQRIADEYLPALAKACGH